MAYKPGIFQYGTIGADGGGYDQGPITNLPPFNVNEPPGFDNLNDLDLYNAGLSSGNIFYGGYVPGGGGSAGSGSTVVAGAGGYVDPVNQDLFKRGLVGPAGDAANLAANPNYKDASSGAGVTPASGTVTLPPVNVNQTNLSGDGGYIDPVNQGLFRQGLIGPAGDAANIGSVSTPASGTVNLPPVEVAGTKINDGEMTDAQAASLMNTLMSGVNPGYVPPSSSSSATSSSGITTLAPVTATGGYTNPNSIELWNAGMIGPASDPNNRALNPNVTTLPPVTVSGSTADPATTLRRIQQGINPVSIFNEPPTTLPPVTVTEPPIGPGDPPRIPPTVLPPFTVTEPPIAPPVIPPTVIPPVVIPPVAPPVIPPPVTPPPVVPSTVIPSVPFDPNTVNSGVGTYGTNAQTLTTKRDFGKELEETLAALQKNQSGIMGMYGDLYKQFMPKGITDTESSVIDQYKTDLARLQQRQAGVLAPEDIRQSQQAAREAYGARGQVMGRGAVGAEIMGRENIRQQREDQARAGMQASYGNIMNMANLQTGNIFSPIGNLMSNTFNPLSPYAADVYGTNVNAQLAKEIAQKNYDAAVRSAELSGAAQKSAATTSAAGNILGPAIGGVVAKGLGAIFSAGSSLALSCMPGDQCIDTPTGPKAIKDLKGGDSVIGYDGEVAFIAQACSWNQNPLRTFLTITREDGSSFTVCDDHKIMGIPAMEWVEGAELAGSLIKSIEASTGLLTSYDILTNQGGYRINGIPVNSMIPEIVMQVVEFHRQVDRNLQAIST